MIGQEGTQKTVHSRDVSSQDLVERLGNLQILQKLIVNEFHDPIELLDYAGSVMQLSKRITNMSFYYGVNVDRLKLVVRRQK